jgi:hypothetical protein
MAKKEKKKKDKKKKPDEIKAPDAAPAEAGARVKSGGGALFAAASLFSALFVIAAVLAGFLFLIVKMNAMGVADAYEDEIAKIPLLNMALPDRVKTDPSEMSQSELATVYNAAISENERLKIDIEGANRRIDELSRAKSEFDAQIMINDEKTEQMRQQVLSLEADKKKLGDMKYDLERLIAAGDKEAFARYYEEVSPEVAQEIYAQIMREIRADDEKRQFIKLFGALDTKASAQIIETLGSARIDFICDTLSSVKKDIAAEIISSLSPELAARVTLRLSGN